MALLVTFTQGIAAKHTARSCGSVVRTAFPKIYDLLVNTGLAMPYQNLQSVVYID